MDKTNQEIIEKFQAKPKVLNWKEEQSFDLETPNKAKLHISRIVYIGENADPDNPKRCISLTKNGKSVAFDIEMGDAGAAAIQELCDGFIPAEMSY